MLVYGGIDYSNQSLHQVSIVEQILSRFAFVSLEHPMKNIWIELLTA